MMCRRKPCEMNVSEDRIGDLGARALICVPTTADMEAANLATKRSPGITIDSIGRSMPEELVASSVEGRLLMGNPSLSRAVAKGVEGPVRKSIVAALG
jgi:hypothetical protein